MVARTLTLPVTIRLSGTLQLSETRMVIAGAHAVTLETTLPASELSLSVVSSFIGLMRTGTQVTHLAAAAGDFQWTAHRYDSDAWLPAPAARRRCLLDHLAEVHEVLVLLGAQPTTDIDDRAEAALTG